jgi:hypothetical protein
VKRNDKGLPVYMRCPTESYRLQLMNWDPIKLAYDSSIMEKTAPLIHGAMMLGGLLGAAEILGSHYESGMKHQAVSPSTRLDFRSSTTVIGGPVPNGVAP